MKRSLKFKRKSRSGPHTPGSYHYVLEKQEDQLPHPWKTCYELVEWHEMERIFGKQSSLSPEKHLEGLLKEIKARIKVTQNEIFKIGELLFYAKNICNQQKMKFQEWVINNLDFSYETAHNFMNVYKQCFGMRHIAMNVSASILYQISAPSFPDELRKYLFDNGQLDNITCGQLREVIKRYKEGGFDAIKDDIDKFTHGHLIDIQTSYTLDIVKNGLRVLVDIKEKLEKGRTGNAIIAFEDQIKYDEPAAFDINSKLIDALQSAITSLDAAQQEAYEILGQHITAIREALGVVEPDERYKERRLAKLNARLGGQGDR